MEEDPSTGNLFEDPPDYYPPSPPPKTETYALLSGKVLTLRLVGSSPLEAHHLWNGARIVSRHFEDDPSLVRDKTVLELGAAAGLPSLVCGALGCRRAVVTDFPDPELVENMQKNIDAMEETLGDAGKGRVTAKGYVWGADVSPLLEELPASSVPPEGFDVLILADLLFRHSEHGKLVKTIREAMARRAGSRAYVVFTSYRPWLRHKDLAFFDLCREDGFVVEQVLDKRLEKPLFEGDPGDVEVQKTVTGWVVRWPEDVCGG